MGRLCFGGMKQHDAARTHLRQPLFQIARGRIAVRRQIDVKQVDILAGDVRKRTGEAAAGERRKPRIKRVVIGLQRTERFVITMAMRQSFKANTGAIGSQAECLNGLKEGEIHVAVVDTEATTVFGFNASTIQSANGVCSSCDEGPMTQAGYASSRPPSIVRDGGCSTATMCPTLSPSLQHCTLQGLQLQS